MGRRPIGLRDLHLKLFIILVLIKYTLPTHFTFPDQCFALALTELDWKVRSTWNDQFWKRGLEHSERSELCGMTSK